MKSSRSRRARRPAPRNTRLRPERLEDRVNPGLVAAFGFNDGSGTTLPDLSGAGNHGTIAGATWVDAGRFGKALSFDGVNDWVTIPDANSLDLTAGMTLEAWVKPTAINGWETVLLKESASDLAYALYADNNGNDNGGPHVPGVWIRQASGTSFATGPAQLPLNTWTHLAATYDGAVVQMYVNGTPAGSLERTGPITTTGKPLRIGGNSVWSEWFNGLIDEVRVYNNALSQAEIQQDMLTPVVPDTTPPTVKAADPAPGSTGVSTNSDFDVTFSEPMDPNTINSNTLELRDAANALVPATVTYDGATSTATLTPSVMLHVASTYSVRVRGGTSGPAVADRSGNRLAADYTLSVTTAPAAQPGPENVFARFDGTVTSATGPAVVPIHITSANFTITHGADEPQGLHAIFGFVVSPVAGGGLSPQGVKIVNTTPDATGAVDPTRGVHVLKTRTALPDGSSLVLVELGYGDYNVQVRGRDGTTGAWTLTTYLVGDVNGDFRVTDADVALLHDYQHGLNTNPAVLAAGDADRNGRIRDYDLTLAGWNVGNATSIRVLGVTAGLDSASDTGLPGDGLVNHTPVNIVGLARPGAQVTLDKDGNGFNDGSTTAGADGAYTLPAPLVEGANALRVRAQDGFGQQATAATAVRLDTQLTTPAYDLSAGSDTGTAGDHITSAGSVTLVGQTDPGETVTLLKAGATVATALASGTGKFQFAGVALALGDNQFTAHVVDAAGNVRDFTRTLTRVAPDPGAQDVVLRWNQATLDAIRLDATTPPAATRALAMVGTAIFDAVSAIEGTPGYLVKLTPPAGASAEAAAAAAAHKVLSYLYPAQQVAFDATLAAALAQVPAGLPKTDGVTFGRSVADAVIALRANDGARAFVDYAPANTNPGTWQPTPPMFDEALLPQWAAVTPFALSSPSQFRPAAPPALTSADYAAAVNEVKAKGRATGSTRTADETQAALFWADGAGTVTPPGHWDQIAMQIASAQGYSLSANARLFAELNVALADAAIACWDAKFFYNEWRPVTAIQKADTDGNSQTTPDAAWTPLLMTPNFPSYVSGHSTFSGAAQVILESVFGANVGFTATTEAPGVASRTFSSFKQAAEEAGQSRVLGGIHYQFDNQAGLATGRSVASFVLQAFTLSADTRPPTVSIQSPAAGLVTAANVTVRGQVLDNLSGVKSLEVQLDGGSYTAVAPDAGGNFAVPTAFALNGSADGAHTLRFRATDFTGNVSTPLAYTFTLDTRAPTLAISAPLANAALTTASRLTGTVSGTGSAVTVLCYAFDGGTKFSAVFDPTTGAFDEALDLSSLAAGSHSLAVTARDAAGNTFTTTLSVALPSAIALAVTDFTPANGSTDVGSTQRPKVTFSRAIDKTTLNGNNFFATDSTGTRLPANIAVSDDNTYAWLFFTNPMPGGSTVTVTVDGSTIRAADGSRLDAARTGTPGSKLVSRFTTVSLAGLPGTSLTGIVADPGPDLKPGTTDDVRRGPDGVLLTADDVYLNPIAHVKVFILGQESQAVFTDAQGRFTLANVPAGDIKLALEGTAATNAPAGCYFADMVMDLTLDAGRVNTVMGSMGTPEERAASAAVQGVYLPRLKSSILQAVSTTTVTHVGINSDSAPNLTPQQQQALSIDVQPGSLIGPDGQKLPAGQIGISTVPPELVRDMLPPGVLQHTFDITVQAPGIATFSKPAPMTFPNVFNAPPGTKLDFLSFDHTTGMLVIEGTATVSADGLSVTTDPGTGITHPGWHGLTPPGGPSDPPCPPTSHTQDVAPVPVTFGLQDQFYSTDGGQFEFGIGNAARKIDPSKGPCDPVNVKATPLDVELTVDGPSGSFLSGMPGTTSFQLEPGQQQQWKVSEVALLPNIKLLTNDQFYAIQVHVVAYKDGDASHKLIDETFTVSRYEAVVDPKAPSLKSPFLKTVDNGTIRTKGFDYHLPSMVETTFTASGSDAGLFNFGGAVKNSGTDNWTFKPTSAGSFSTSVMIQVGSKALSKQLTATGTGVDVTTLGVNISGLTTALNTYLTSAKYFDGTAGVEQASAAFRSARDASRAATGSDAAFVTSITDAVLNQVTTRYSGVPAISVVSASGSVDWQVPLGGLSPGQGAVTRNNPTLGGLKTQTIPTVGLSLGDVLFSTTLPLAAKTYTFGEGMQQGGTVTMTLEDLIHDSPAQVGEVLGEILAHELGHTLALEDAYQYAPTASPPLPYTLRDPQDLMSQDRSSTIKFAPQNITSLTFTAGSEADAIGTAVKAALHIYELNWNSSTQPAHTTVESAPNLPGGGALTVNSPTQGFGNGAQLDFGTVLADGPGGASKSVALALRNNGEAPLTITDVQLASGSLGFSIAGASTAGITLAPGDTATLNLLFDPGAAAATSDTLTINSTDSGFPFTLLLNGSGLTTTGQLSVTLDPSPTTGEPDNNFGGSKLGDRVTRHGYVTVTNTGGGNLTVTQVLIAAGANDFSVGALPTGFDTTHPLLLIPGQSFSFDLSFDPSAAGLRRGSINIVSDDPNSLTSVLRVMGTGLPNAGSNLHYGTDYVVLQTGNSSNPQAFRQVSDQAGMWSFFLAPQTSYHYVIFDPVSGLVAHGYGVSAPSGQETMLPTPVFEASTAPDSDGDGLPDDIEFAIGSNAHKIDTNGDGIDDFAAIQQGLDPLGGHAFPTGVIASLPLQGQAREVVAQGSLSDPNGQTLYVATGSYGLAVVNATQFGKPVLLGQLQLPGPSTDVAFDPAHSLAVVAAGPSGLHLVDVSNPATPVLQRTIALSGGAQCVEVADGLAYVGNGGNVVSIDLATGKVLQTLALGGGTISDLAREGTMLYSMTTSRVLRAIDISGFTMVAKGSLALANGGGKLFVGNGIAYVPVGGTFSAGGFSTVNVSNPNALALIAGPSQPGTGKPGTAVVANGSGLGLLAGALNFVFGGFTAVDVVSLTDPTNTYNFLTRFNLPAAPNSVAIAGGIAYVADDTSGLQVVNFVPFDTNGVAPTVSISTPAADADTATPGLQVVEGATLPVQANVADDVQVRNVELLVNGQVVSNDLSFPFDLSAIAPSIAASGTTFTIQVRATDTGGNVGLSNVLTVGLVRDTFAPTVTDFVPPTNSSQIEPIQVVQVRFSEPMAAGTVTPGTIRVRDSAGTFLTPTDFQLRVNDQLAQLTFPALLTGSYQIVVSGGVTDRAGNRLGASDVISPFTLTPRATLTTAAADDDPVAPGLQVFEGRTLPLSVSVTAGVSVQKVELLVNGLVVATDTTAPYSFSVIAPNIAPGADTLTLQAKVTDTAGLATFTTPPLTVGLLEDVTPPAITGTNPANGGSTFKGVTTVQVSFSEPIATATAVAANFSLVEAGPGGLFGDGNDVAIPITAVGTSNDDTVVQLTTAPLDPGTYQLQVRKDGITDRAGNPAGTGFFTSAFTVQDRPGLTDLLNLRGTPVTGNLILSSDKLTLAVNTAGSLIVGGTGLVFDGREFVIWGTPVWNYSFTVNGQIFANGSGLGTLTREDLSSGSFHGVRIVGATASVRMERVIAFNDGDQFAVIATRLTNLTGSPLANAAAMENTDPDQGIAVGLGFDTSNDVVFGGHVVRASVASSQYPGGLTLAFGSADVRAVASAEGFSNVSPFDIINSPVDPNGAPGDIGINLAVNYGTVPAFGTVSSGTLVVLGKSTAEADQTYQLAAPITTTGVGQPQLFAGRPKEPGPGTARLDPARLPQLVGQAVASLAAAGFDVSALSQVQFDVIDLPGSLLGWTARNMIWIDQDAAGYGWYTDATDGSDVSFGQPAGEHERQALSGSPAYSHVDLLTVVTHELGHVLGFASIDAGVLDHDWMTATLGTGVRRAPDAADGSRLPSAGGARPLTAPHSPVGDAAAVAQPVPPVPAPRPVEEPALVMHGVRLDTPALDPWPHAIGLLQTPTVEPRTVRRNAPEDRTPAWLTGWDADLLASAGLFAGEPWPSKGKGSRPLAYRVDSARDGDTLDAEAGKLDQVIVF